MKKEKDLIFANLLKKREQLSEDNKQNKQIISSVDAQLMDTLKNFNESDDYKKMQPDN